MSSSDSGGGRSMFEMVHRERRHAQETGYKDIIHIRVTPDAMSGAPVSVPITPERARVLGPLLAVPRRGDNGEISVVADPGWYEKQLELLIHPQDWADLLCEKDALMAYAPALREGEPERVFGIPVSR